VTWWTAAQIRVLRDLASQGLSGRQIASSLNAAYGTPFSPGAVRRQASEHKIRLRGRHGPPQGCNSASLSRERDQLGRFVG
jgi:hypothetical protein